MNNIQFDQSNGQHLLPVIFIFFILMAIGFKPSFIGFLGVVKLPSLINLCVSVLLCSYFKRDAVFLMSGLSIPSPKGINTIK